MSARIPRLVAASGTVTIAAVLAFAVPCSGASAAAVASAGAGAGVAVSVMGAPPESPTATATTSVDIFVGGEGGYPVYRIPAITRITAATRRGRLLAFAEGRGNLADNGTNDLVLRVSDDDGATFGPYRTICDLPGRSLNNPCVVEVASGAHAGRVLLMFQSYPEGCGEGCVIAGYDVADGGKADGKDADKVADKDASKDRICRTLVMHSDDAGDTWSAPREVTREVKRATRATSVATGPGIGIQLARGAHKGRVIMPFNEGPPDQWRVYAAYSDDGGDSWKLGDPAPDDEKGVGNEVQMFERADGSVVLNARQHLGPKLRTQAVSTDGGATWSRLSDIAELPDPQCMGGVLALDATILGASTPDASIVVFTGCDSPSRRALGTMWISRDGGATWPQKVLVEPEGFAYSLPVQLASGEIGVVHETGGYKRIVLRRVTVPAAAASPAAR
ncbi:MAG: sialidase family protein [Phycisphaerales bacterium]